MPKENPSLTHSRLVYEQKPDRGAFWGYCRRAVNGARMRSKAKGIPFDLDIYAIDCLLVDQGWRCAITGIPLVAPNGSQEPYGPSLDRIVPKLGYVPGNVRIVCNIANTAMNSWGLDAHMKMVALLKALRS